MQAVNGSPLSAAVRRAYQAGEDDETMEPLILVDAQGQPVGRLQQGDFAIFYNIRGEREIELTESLTDPHFAHFPTDVKVRMVTMIQYDEKLDVQVAFPPLGVVEETLSEVVSRHGLRQVKIAETEKAVHLRFFLNGKRTEPFPGEEHVFIPTRKDIASFSECPEMSVAEVADAAIDRLRDGRDDLLVVNFANVDVVGHLEDAAAVRRAIEAVDTQVGRVVAAAQAAGVTVLLTADHGTVEEWLYPEGTINTGHTANPVPCVLIAPPPAPPHAGGSPRGGPGVTQGLRLRADGALTDVAPTVLALLGLPVPEVMTGKPLLSDGRIPALGRQRVLLLIADGWGLRDETEGNLIAQAHTPVMDRLQARYPSTRLRASGEAVGLPPGTVGNSEVGHLHLGAGRVIPSDRVRIQAALDDGSFLENEAFRWAMQGAKQQGKRLHLIGIISFFSSHGSIDYAIKLLEMAAREGVSEVYLHGMLGRRGERPESGAIYLEKIEAAARRFGVGQVVTVLGRFWSLDREENWDRIEKTYRALVRGEGRPVRGEGN